MSLSHMFFRLPSARIMPMTIMLSAVLQPPGCESAESMTAVVYYILLSLVKARHGYGIMQMAEKLSGGRVRLAAGTLYGALNSLCRKGWIEALPEEDGSWKKEYKITAGGARRWEVWKMARKTVKRWIWAWRFDQEERWLNEEAAGGNLLAGLNMLQYSGWFCVGTKFRDVGMYDNRAGENRRSTVVEVLPLRIFETESACHLH